MSRTAARRHRAGRRSPSCIAASAARADDARISPAAASGSSATGQRTDRALALRTERVLALKTHRVGGGQARPLLIGREEPAYLVLLGECLGVASGERSADELQEPEIAGRDLVVAPLAVESHHLDRP